MTEARTYEVEVADDASDSQIIEAFWKGELRRIADVGTIQVEPMMAADGIAALDELGRL